MFSFRTYIRWLRSIGFQACVSWHQVLKALVHEFMLDFDEDYVVWLVRYHTGKELFHPDTEE